MHSSLIERQDDNFLVPNGDAAAFQTSKDQKLPARMLLFRASSFSLPQCSSFRAGHSSLWCLPQAWAVQRQFILMWAEREPFLSPLPRFPRVFKRLIQRQASCSHMANFCGDFCFWKGTCPGRRAGGSQAAAGRGDPRVWDGWIYSNAGTSMQDAGRQPPLQESCKSLPCLSGKTETLWRGWEEGTRRQGMCLKETGEMEKGSQTAISRGLPVRWHAASRTSTNCEPVNSSSKKRAIMPDDEWSCYALLSSCYDLFPKWLQVLEEIAG